MRTFDACRTLPVLALIIGYAPAVARARTIGAYYLIRDLIVIGGAFIGVGL